MAEKDTVVIPRSVRAHACVLTFLARRGRWMIFHCRWINSTIVDLNSLLQSVITDVSAPMIFPSYNRF